MNPRPIQPAREESATLRRHSQNDPSPDVFGLLQAMDANPDGVLIVDPAGVVLFSNHHAREILGDGTADPGCSFPLPGGIDDTMVYAKTSQDGQVRRFERQVASIDWNGEPARLITLRDGSGIAVIEQQLLRVNRLYSALGQTARACARATSEIMLYEDVCRIAVAFGGFKLARIGKPDADRRLLVDVSTAGAASNCTKHVQVHLDPVHPEGQGPGARALRLGVPYVCNDLIVDPNVHLWREIAAKYRLASLAAFPIVTAGVTHAVWLVYAGEKGYFDSTLLNLLGQMAAEIGAGLERIAGREARHRAEKALEKSEALLRQMASANSHVFWLRDLETHQLLYVSPAFESVFGRPVSAAPQSYDDWLAMLHPDDRPRFEAMLKHGKSDRVTVQRYRIVRPDGVVRWVEDEITPIREDGRMVRLSGNLTDITEKLAAHRQIEFFRELVCASSDGFFIVRPNAQWRLEFINPAGATHLGRSNDELKQLSIWDWDMNLTPDACLATREVLKQQTSIRFESRHRRPDGTLRHVEMVLNRLIHEGDTLVGGWFRDITRRKQIDAEMRESEEKFQSLFYESPDALAILETESLQVLDCNQRLLEMFDVKNVAELLEHDVDEFLLEPFGQDTTTTLFDQLSSSRAITREVEFTSFEGRRFWATAVARKISHGERNLVLVRFTDITERRRMTELLADAQKCAQIGGWEYRIDEDQFTCTDGVHHILEVDPSESLSFPQLLAFFRPESRTRIDEAVSRATSHGESFRLELDLTTAAGREIWVRIDGRAESSDGQPWRLYGMCQDITEEHLAHIAMLEREEKLEHQALLLDEANDAITLRSLEGVVLYWNRGATRLLGWTEDQAVGRRAEDLHFNRTDLLRTHTRTVVREGKWNGEIVLKTSSGHSVTVESRWTLIRDQQGKPKAVLAIDSDITERKRMEASFIRAQRLESIGTLAGGIAHDLNNILSPILLSSDLLRLQLADTPESELIETITTSARRGADVVRQILSFSRGATGGFVALDLRPLVEDIGRLVQETFPRNIQFESLAPHGIRLVRGDPTQIHQVLLNLCVNARDAMPKGGVLRLEVENVVEPDNGSPPESTPRVRIRVSDTGIGIPKEMQGRIFEPFFTTKPDGKGTGLGLSTVATILQRHGGTITIAETTERGSTFEIILPATVSSTPWVGPEGLGDLPCGDGELVLVIDDEKSVCSMIRQSLESSGYRVLTAGDGAEGASMFMEHRNEVAAVLTDMMMPVMDGSLLIQTLRKIDPRTPILAMSGVSAMERRASDADGPGDSIQFLQKPFTMETLLVAIREGIERRPVED